MWQYRELFSCPEYDSSSCGTAKKKKNVSVGHAIIAGDLNLFDPKFPLTECMQQFEPEHIHMTHWTYSDRVLVFPRSTNVIDPVCLHANRPTLVGETAAPLGMSTILTVFTQDAAGGPPTVRCWRKANIGVITG